MLVGVGVWVWYRLWVQLHVCDDKIKVVDRVALVNEFRRASDMDVFQTQISSVILVPIWVSLQFEFNF